MNSATVFQKFPLDQNYLMVFFSRVVIGDQKFESGFESESESTLFFLNLNPDSYILALNPNPDPNPVQKALNPDSNPNPDSDSHITGP